eukprot:TRINITY_DN349_c0_g1_i1.p1 TRINITY_DN349_c0_g1~~TRINITY_DN349_c0_g1_i1.p1  ORF type:complete len:499 (-),score=173.56 TRINITY_DN349_c0_g1_i1:48-1403(-)
MLGFLKQTYNSSINGLNGDESNPVDFTAGAQQITVNHNSPYVDPDPDHTNPGTLLQTWGDLEPQSVPVAPMDGFVVAAKKIGISDGSVMSCFNETAVPTISTLAREFAIIDGWFSDVPGPTEVNRLYLYSATSHGWAYNDDLKLGLGYPQTSIFYNLHESNKTFNVFFEDIPTSLFLKDVRRPRLLENFHFMRDFEKVVSAGKLADFTFLEPKYISLDHDKFASDQHPSHDVAEGEELMAKIYHILRHGPQWNETALLITYDEHGGFFDHVPTPSTDIPNPDGLNSESPPFNFTQLGVRVPAVLVSPWINPGTIIRADGRGPTPSSTFSHSSLASTIKNLFDLPTPYLTKRDEWATPFDWAFLDRTSPRTDCPEKMPTPNRFKSAALKAREHMQPLNGFQRTLVNFVNYMSGYPLFDTDSLITERDGALFVRERIEDFMQANGIPFEFPDW